MVLLPHCPEGCEQLCVIGKHLNLALHVDHKEDGPQYTSLRNAAGYVAFLGLLSVDHYALSSICKEFVYPSKKLTSDATSRDLSHESTMRNTVKCFLKVCVDNIHTSPLVDDFCP